MSSRDLESARQAFKDGDVNQSQLAHMSSTHAAKERQHKKEGGEIVTSLVFGGLDGIVTTFAVLVASAAQNLLVKTLLILTFANLVGDAIGMAVGDWLSSVAERGLERSERARERLEMETKPDEEKREMIAIYVEKGLSADDARELVDLLMLNPEAFHEIMCVYELGIMPENVGSSPLKDGVVTFISFMICSAIPMLAYVFCFAYDAKASLDYLFWISIALFVLTLFALGVVKGIITNSRWWLSGLITLLQGAVTTVAAYFISFGFERITF